ncbi:hypothetical protein KV102_12045 [Mumia sp. zg.B53]|uniref:hypothetical protein n=1 Tax=Mumia sp. zg.B53 TaxID=2855449 RepID=UPI001C6E393C|nr:hypothetical protein [Mumia sp. zg.B53]MBW9215572.1 hypothetical protein [Mumia sp. zg.B53]
MGPEAIASERSVSRATLRQVLFSGIDAVEFGKVFTHYESRSDGTVTAFFRDGTSAMADLLVGADGTRSAVRAQFLPEATIRDTGITAIATKTPLTDETRALLPPEVAKGLSLIFANTGMLGILHVMAFPWDADGNPKDARFADVIGAWPDLAFDNTRDYINLAIWSPHEHFRQTRLTFVAASSSRSLSIRR